MTTARTAAVPAATRRWATDLRCCPAGSQDLETRAVRLEAGEAQSSEHAGAEGQDQQSPKLRYAITVGSAGARHDLDLGGVAGRHPAIGRIRFPQGIPPHAGNFPLAHGLCDTGDLSG